MSQHLTAVQPVTIVHRPDDTTRKFDCAVIIPAMNEEQRIGACLHALGDQSALGETRVLVVIVANNCTDNTVRASRTCVESLNIPALILNATICSSQGVGRARSLGADHALAYLHERGNILTTDADCLVDRRWVARSMQTLLTMDVVCGMVKPQTDEACQLPVSINAPGKLEHDYWEVSLEYDAVVDPDPCNPWPHHGRAAGASLGFRRTAYHRSGGFDSIPTGEDRELIARMSSSRYRIRYASDVTVQASCRLQGRAPNGMACALARRVADLDSLADEALEPAHVRINRVTSRVRCREILTRGRSLVPLLNELSIEPTLVPENLYSFSSPWQWIERHSPKLARVRLRPSELPHEIAVLTQALAKARQQKNCNERLVPLHQASNDQTDRSIRAPLAAHYRHLGT